MLNGQTTSYADESDWITSAGASAGATSYTVNASGNLVARGTDSGYDQANRLTSANVAGTTSTDVYDGDGKRTRKTVGTTTTSYVYDVGGGLPVLLDDGTRKYVWGAGGLAHSVDKSSGAVQVYHTDGLGSVRALTDSTGSVVQTYQTDEFGVPSLTQGTSTQPFGYTGEQGDPEDGLVYLRSRMYDPTVGRFLQADPLRKSGPAGSGWNRYPYASGNPIARRDPSGFITYFLRGIGPGDISDEEQAFINELQNLRTDQVVGVHGIFTGTREENALYVLRANIDASQDVYASNLAQRVLKETKNLPAGEEINFIGLSGGLTIAFNAAQKLNERGVKIANIVGIGGWVSEWKPESVRKWSEIDSVMDVVRNHPVADQYYFLIPGPDHTQYFDLAERGTAVKDSANALSSPP